MSNENSFLVVNNPYQIALSKLEETFEQVTAKLSEHRAFCEVATNYEKRKDKTAKLILKFHELVDIVSSKNLNKENTETESAQIKQIQKQLIDFENFCSVEARDKEHALENQIEVLNEAICDIKRSVQKWYSHYGKLDIDPEIIGFRYEQRPK
ncbi:conserved hypothetical protein [Vibrio chagasii]|nr:conserved hypothetical protein [Vibrio chagasii]CAH7361142.1 conserved hypothetical protein [Vibrio chagasii]